MKPGYFLTPLFFLPFIANADEKVKILQNGTFHGAEVADAVNNENWLAIVQENGTFTSRQVNISVKIVKDEVLDEDETFTGKEISSDPNAILLVKGLNLADGEKIRSYDIDNSPIEGDTKIIIGSDNEELSIFAKQDIHFKNGEIESYKGYQLFAKNGTKETALTKIEKPNDAVPKLIWAGDINNDGYADLLINITFHYNMNIPALYLSKETPDGVTYIKVAELTLTGC